MMMKAKSPPRRRPWPTAMSGSALLLSLAISPIYASPENMLIGSGAQLIGLEADGTVVIAANPDLGLHGAGLLNVRSATQSGATSEDLSELNGINGSGLRGINGSGLRGIHGSGLRGINGSGLRGIHGSGLRGINGSGLRGIHGSGLRGINGSGLRGIHGSGLRGINGSGLRTQSNASNSQIDARSDLLVIGQVDSVDATFSSFTVAGQEIFVIETTLTLGSDDVGLPMLGAYVAVSGDLLAPGQAIGSAVINLPTDYIEGVSPTYVRAQTESVDNAPHIRTAGALQIDTGNASWTEGQTASSPVQIIETVGHVSDGKLIAFSAAVLADDEILTSAAPSLTDDSSSNLNGINGSGLRGINGSGLRGIHGSGLRGINGSGLRGINGSGLRGIHGSGLRGINGSGLRGINGSGLRGIHGSGLRSAESESGN